MCEHGGGFCHAGSFPRKRGHRMPCDARTAEAGYGHTPILPRAGRGPLCVKGCVWVGAGPMLGTKSHQ